MSAAMPLTSVFFFGVVAVWVGAALRLARTMQPEERESINKVCGFFMRALAGLAAWCCAPIVLLMLLLRDSRARTLMQRLLGLGLSRPVPVIAGLQTHPCCSLPPSPSPDH